MTATEALERRIDELCAEVERLRLRHEGYVVDLQEALAENARLRQENAKLRELVRDMRTCIDHACMCEFCPLFITSEDMGERRCIADVKAHMRELGVDDG